MPKLVTLLLLLATFTYAPAQEDAAGPPAKAELPSVEQCIPKSVSNLREPPVFIFHKGLVTAVSAANEEAQVHTLQGLNYLHGSWEFEAMRHFAVAMKADPNCLMAHWGMIMSMLAPSPETDSYRLATTERLLQLISDGEGTKLERGFAYGLVKYIEEGPNGAERAFRQIAEKFPDDPQSQIFAALFGRGGYNEMGDITPDQLKAEERLINLVRSSPNDALPLHALLLIRAEAPDLKTSLKLARKLCQIVPDYAPYFHLLGHYEWRCGEHARAASAFGRAASLYSNWMKENKATPADCPGWVRSECYRVVAMASKGEYDNALASAEKIANTTLDPDRADAAGTRELLWNAKTLPARVFLRRSAEGDSEKALASLPSPESIESFRDHSLSYWWIDGLRIALEAQRLMDANDIKNATDTVGAVSYHGQAMARKQQIAAAIGEFSEWRRSFTAMEILAAELRGRLALAGPKEGHGSAFNWFRAATDRQRATTMLSPPPILTPMATRLGDYFLTAKKPARALEAYKEALEKFPEDQETLNQVEKAKEMALTIPVEKEE
jgi:tetratricopeptide (TPR) repeat protein